MKCALEVAHIGWGVSCIIGFSENEVNIKTSKFITGRIWKGTYFGGWKSRSDIPKLGR